MSVAGYDSTLALPTHPAVIASVTALERATVGAGNTPLPAPAYLFVFPLLAAVLKWPTHTALHDPALNVVALHVDPDRDLPRAASLDMLFSMLDVLPAFRCTPAVHGLPSAHVILIFQVGHMQRAPKTCRCCARCAFRHELCRGSLSLLNSFHATTCMMASSLLLANVQSP